MEWIRLFLLVIIIIIICVSVWVPDAEIVSQTECEKLQRTLWSQLSSTCSWVSMVELGPPAWPGKHHCLLSHLISTVFFLLSLHEEIKQIHILTNNREENYNQRQKITHRIRRIMEVCLQFNCYTHCIILGVTCALHKHKKPWNMENKYLCGDLRRIFLSHIYTNRIPQVLEHRFTQKRMMKCREYRIN